MIVLLDEKNLDEVMALRQGTKLDKGYSLVKLRNAATLYCSANSQGPGATSSMHPLSILAQLDI